MTVREEKITYNPKSTNGILNEHLNAIYNVSDVVTTTTYTTLVTRALCQKS